MRALANSEDPDEMPHNSPFAKAKQYSEKYIYNFYWKLEPVTPPSFIVSNQKEESISVLRLKLHCTFCHS